LGFGFRCGFLGLLHLEVIRDRIEREYNIELITTAPSVIYHIYMRDETMVELHNPADMPDLSKVDHLEEPRIKATILVPDEYLGDVLKLCQDRRGIQEDLTYAGSRAMVVYDLPLNEDELAALRQEEQTAAALAVGVQDLHWLNYPDGRVVNSLDLRRDISRVIRIVQPDVVVTQPTEANWDRIYGSHPDHLATAWATMAAVYPDARNPRSHPELLAEGHQPHTVKQVWMMWMAAPQGKMLHVDITATFEEKVKALRCHSSQTDRIEGLDDLLREWASGVAATADMPPDTLAEGFRVIDTE